MKDSTWEEISGVNDKFYNAKQEVMNKIFNADTGIDNEALRRVQKEVLKHGDRELAEELHTAMFENRAVMRVKHAERVSSSLNEWFDADAFSGKIKAEGDVKERNVVASKSEAFKDAPYFSVGMYQHNIDEPDVKDAYIKRVKQLTKDMEYQVSFAVNRENHMNRTIEAAKQLLGVEVFNKLYAGETLSISPEIEPNLVSEQKTVVKEQPEVNTLKEIEDVNEQFYQVKRQVDEKIFNAETGVDNAALKRVQEEILKQGNRNLSEEVHTAMYENRAVMRVKHAERVSSSLGEWFNKDAFNEKIKAEGDIKERDVVMPKSEAFKDAPHFAVGMLPTNINDSVAKDAYINRVQTLTKEMAYQVDFAVNRENHMNRTIEAAKEFLGVEVFNKLYAGESLEISQPAVVKTQEEVFKEIWSGSSVENFQKKGEVLARKAIEGEKINTIIDGELETTNVAKKGDVVVKGVKDEEYIMSKEKFDNRYSGGEVGDAFSTFKAKGKTWAMEYVGKPIEFVASWGEKMILKTGDFLCNPEKDKPGDLYRIEKSAFKQTYEKVVGLRDKLKTVKDSLAEPTSPENTNKNRIKPS